MRSLLHTPAALSSRRIPWYPLRMRLKGNGTEEKNTVRLSAQGVTYPQRCFRHALVGLVSCY
jgi:hypothetical protein